MNIRTLAVTAFTAAAIAWLSLGATSALAQKKMYRCGSQYQDRPCEAGTPAQPAAKSAEKSVNAMNQATPAAAGTQRTAAEERALQQRQIRCENYGRQRDELVERRKGMVAGGGADSMTSQVKVLESRMQSDGCCSARGARPAPAARRPGP